MPSDSYIKKYGHSRVRSKKIPPLKGDKGGCLIRSSKQIHMPIQTHKTITPPELIEKPTHPDIIKITPILRDHHALEQHSALVWKFIREGK